MNADIIPRSLGPALLSHLVESNMITIICIDSQSRRTKLTIPEVLACAASTRLRELCSASQKRTFTSDEILSERTSAFESRLFANDFRHYMSRFILWIYSIDTYDPENFYSDLWYLGHRLRAPKFQNHVMQQLMTLRIPDRQDVVHHHIKSAFWDSWTSSAIGTIYKQAGLAGDACNDHQSDDQIFWKNKQMLRFVVDVFAYFGPGDREVRQALLLDDQPARLLRATLELNADRNGFGKAPWDESRRQKYLVDENYNSSLAALALECPICQNPATHCLHYEELEEPWRVQVVRMDS